MNKHILNDHFDNIYILYIDNEEKEKITPKLQKRSINVQFFEGVNGYKIVDRYNAYVKNYNVVHKNNPDAKLLNQGSYGHILSFINILKDARIKKYNRVLILEPDIYFADNFDKLCTKYLSMDYGMLYFGASQNLYYREETWTHIDKECDTELKKGFYYAHNTLGTFGLGIHSNMYSNCIDALIKMEAPTDVSFINIQNKYRKKCIVTYPNIICCDLTHSKTSITKNQIESLPKLRWTLKYDFQDSLSIKTEINCWYEVVMSINSYFPTFSIKLLDNNKNEIFPEITNKNYKYFSINNRLTVYCLVKTSTTTIFTKDLFLNSVSVSKVNKQYMKLKVPIHNINKIRGSDVAQYYITNVF